MRDPKFSVITPVYNREQTITQVIDSVVKQTCTDWEMILVDDGSTDQTGRICKQYAEMNARIHYIYQNNHGVSSARNTGLRNACGEYIIFLDSDNSLKPHMLSTLADHLADYPQIDMACFGFDTASKPWIPPKFAGNTISASAIHEHFLPEHINIYPQNQHFLLNYIWNKCYKRSFLSEHHITFDESRRTWEDGIFVVNCLDHASSILLIPEVLYHANCEIKVDHLSSHLFEDQIDHYMKDEKEFKKRFEHQYDFNSAHYCRSNFNVISMLFSKAAQAYGPKAKDMIARAVQTDILHFWAQRVTPNDAFENRLLTYIQKGSVNQIYALFHPNLLFRIIRKLIRMLRK